MNWTVAGQIIAALLAAIGGAGVVQAIARRRTTRVEAVNALNATTLDWAEQLKADAADARSSAREARAEAAEARREATEVRKEIAEYRREAAEATRLLRRVRNDSAGIMAYLEWILGLIRKEGMTISQLRASVAARPLPTGPPISLLHPEDQ